MIEQLERDPSNPAGQPLPRTVVISQGVDAAAPVVIEVVVDRESPVSLELLTKLLIVGVVFLATRHIAPSVAIVGAILSAFIPDVVSSIVRRHRWGKKRVGILAALVTFFAALDSAFGKAMRRHRRKPQRPGIGGARQALGAGHAAMTTAAAVTACAIAVTVPALASGGSPFPASRAHASAPAVTPVRAAARTHAQNQQQAARDRFVRLGVSPTGAPGSMTLAPARRVHFEFTLKQPSKVIFAIGTGSTLNAFDLWHDDNQEGSSSIDIDSTHPYTADLTAGPHTITVESTDRQAATLRYVLYASTDLTQAAGISPDGVPGGVTVTPGQRAHLAFTLAQSGHVVFAVSSGSTLAAYSIWHDDNQDGSSSIDIDSTHPYTADLGAGTHTITIEPSGTGAGTLRYVLYASTGINRGMDVSPRGIRGQVGVTPGQRAHLAFTLAQSSHVVFAVSPNSALTAYDIWHDDNQDGSSSIDIDSTHPYTADLAAGTHTITIAPDGAASGALVYTLFASADVTQTVDATPDGTSGSVSVTPGQRAHLEFTLKQPGHVVLAIDPNSTLTAYSIWHDDNQDGSSSIDIDSTRPYTADLAAGTHTITIAPDGATAGELLYKLTAAAPAEPPAPRGRRLGDSFVMATPPAVELPPGPRAPPVWQTIAWMTRPGAFMRGVYTRYGDPATIRTYWTEEPMVLFSSPDAVRAVFRLDPSIAPAGQSWEFLRPFAGPHSILLLDGEEHLRERRLMAGPFHGERMRAFAPIVGDLARAELATWQGRVLALERMRELALQIILRVVFGARDDELTALRRAIDDTLATVRSLPWVLAMAVMRKDLGPRSPWGRFRVAVERFDAILFELLARRREHPGDDDSMLAVLLDQRDEHDNPPSDRHMRDQLVALLVGGHDESAAALAWAFERLARYPRVQARLREGDPAYLDAVVKESLRSRPALTIAPRLLLEPVQIAGRTVPAGVQVAACIWLACRREDLWRGEAEFRPERWLGEEPPPNPMSWIPFGGGVRRCAGAPFAEMEMREVVRAATDLRLRPARAEGERARRSMLVLVPHRGAEVIVG